MMKPAVRSGDPSLSSRSSHVVPIGSWNKVRRTSQKSITTPHSGTPRNPRKTWQVNWGKKKYWLSLIIFLIGIFSGLWWLFSPAPLACRTDEFTNCTPAEQSFFQQNLPTRWRAWQRDPEDVLQQMQSSLPETEKVSISIWPPNALHIKIRRSQTAAVVRVGDTWQRVLTAGQLLSTTEERWPRIYFADQTTWDTWQNQYPSASHSADTLKVLNTTLRSVHPRVTEVQVLSSTEAVMRLENSSRAIVSLENPQDLERQLRTLQGVFNASTMEELPHEVDLRFKNVIIRN